MKKAVIIFFVLWTFKGIAQQFPAFKPLRFDEDYSSLGKDSVDNWYYRIKFNPLSRSKRNYISFGGEARFQYFYTQNESWGDEPGDNDGYVLSRLLLHGDLHIGRHVRTFVQLQSSVAGSRVNTNPLDDNPLDLHQAFVDFKLNTPGKSVLTLRAGRQELLYGSQRLISVRDGPNNRQSFDGINVLLSKKQYRADFFYSHFVAAKKKIFDDGFNKATKLWGVYYSSAFPLFGNIDIYYLGLWKKSAAFNDAVGRELRHSFGSRIWGIKKGWKWDVEALYQAGKIAEKDIAAWTTSINISYQFSKATFKPELGLKTELISGDKKKGDYTVQTFNPLFPRGAYFGLAALIGPANLFDVHPSLSLNFTNQFTFDLDYDIFWRYNSNDGIYAVNTSLIYPDANSREKHIGGQLAGSFTYRPGTFLYFRGEFTWFDAGDYLEIAGAGRDIIFTGITAQLKF